MIYFVFGPDLFPQLYYLQLLLQSVFVFIFVNCVGGGPKRKMIGVGNAVLYRSKKDIDRHVQEQFDKLNNEHEVCSWLGVHLNFVKLCGSKRFIHCPRQ